MKVTEKILDAVMEELGIDEIDPRWVEGILYEHRTMRTATARKELRAIVKEFEAAGGRGVELAEMVDELRVLIAARKADKKRKR